MWVAILVRGQHSLLSWRFPGKTRQRYRMSPYNVTEWWTEEFPAHVSCPQSSNEGAVGRRDELAALWLGGAGETMQAWRPPGRAGPGGQERYLQVTQLGTAGTAGRLWELTCWLVCSSHYAVYGVNREFCQPRQGHSLGNVNIGSVGGQSREKGHCCLIVTEVSPGMREDSVKGLLCYYLMTMTDVIYELRRVLCIKLHRHWHLYDGVPVWSPHYSCVDWWSGVGLRGLLCCVSGD